MTDNKTAPAHPYGYGPLVEECARRGISKTVAFELVKEGNLSTFTIGRKRYVRIDSLERLPDLLQAREKSHDAWLAFKTQHGLMT